MAEEKMVKVDLRNSVAQRSPGGGRGPMYGPGKGVEVPESLARSLGMVPIEEDQKRSMQVADGLRDSFVAPGSYREGADEPNPQQQPRGEAKEIKRDNMDASGRTIGMDTGAGPSQAAGTDADSDAEPSEQKAGSTSEDPYKAMDKEDLEAEAARRGLQVERQDGRTDLSPRTEDYRAALRAADGGDAGDDE